jgi:hypothetical protein
MKSKRLKAGVTFGITTAVKADVKGQCIGTVGISTTQVLDW